MSVIKKTTFTEVDGIQTYYFKDYGKVTLLPDKKYITCPECGQNVNMELINLHYEVSHTCPSTKK